jgi:hypothetical protein
MTLRRMDLVVAGIGLALAGSAVVAPVANAAPAASGCTSSTTHSHTVSARGTVSDRTTLRQACAGHGYQAWAHGWTRSYTGASSTWHSYKDGRDCNPHGRWDSVKVTHSVSARGSVTNRVTSTAGTC